MLNAALFGRFAVKKQMYENEWLVQYWGTDEQEKREVAIAAFCEPLAAPAEFLSRFQPLSRKFNAIASKHAPAFIQSGEAEGQAVVVWEYADGQTLAEIFASAAPQPAEFVLALAQRLGEYLDLLHAAGLTQMVFDPQNILLTPQNAALVSNFGFAHGVNLPALLAAHQVSARPSYAPELLRGSADLRADFYSLGALLYQALVGKEIPPGASPEQTLPDALLPSRARQDLAPEWDALLSKCLQPNPAKRVQSAAEFLNLLDEIRRAAETLASNNPLGMEDSLVGQTLGAYRLVSRLGQGGMATVYKAYEPALDRYVAIKVLPQFFANDPVFVQRFRREAKAVAQLNHPNIVPIYSFGEAGRITYIAMQFVVGDTLKHEGQKFSLDDSLRLLIPIARALAYAHQRGIVHRDVKPSNILVAEGGWPLLADFGLAQMAQVSGKLTESGVGMGTPMYMSPEQGQGEKIDQRSDIYSLGIVLYEMLTGDVPFRADTPMAIVIKHISAPMPMPSSVNPNIPDYLEALILKATAKNPDDRYQTAEELAEAMESARARLLSSPEETRRAPVIQMVKPAPVSAKIPAPQVESPQQPSASILILKGIGSFFKGVYRLLIFLILLGVLLPLLIVGGMAAFKVCPPQGPWPQPPWCAGSPYAFTVGAPQPPATEDVIEDFDRQPAQNRTGWEGYFEDGRDTQLDCSINDSRELGASNYLQYEFDVAENSWSTCGFYYDSPQNWSAAQGIAFDLRAAQPGVGYEINIYGGTPDARTTHLYWAVTTPENVDGWTHIELSWNDILRAEWEDNPHTPLDPAQVTGFAVGVGTDETSRASGILWLDNLQLIRSAPARLEPQPQAPPANLVADFDREAPFNIESYFDEQTDSTSACVLDKSFGLEDSASLRFEFDAAPDAWASCGLSFYDKQIWQDYAGIAFYVHAETADVAYAVNFTVNDGEDKNYQRELQTATESVDGWQRVELRWEDLLRVEWEADAGMPLTPQDIEGVWFEISAPQAARLAGQLWIDSVELIQP
ncbi:MAG: hypothetical protein Fur002_05860 [Anaerolineales bacterium]